MKITSEDINKYADNLMIGLNDEENKLVLDEFDIILQQMDSISNYPNIENIEPMTHALDDFEYVLREDIAKEDISTSELLSNCDHVEASEVEIPKVVG